MLKDEYIALVPFGGGLVHIASMAGPQIRTACDLDCSGWKISLSRPSCEECKLIVHVDARPKKRAGRGPGVTRRRR